MTGQQPVNVAVGKPGARPPWRRRRLPRQRKPSPRKPRLPLRRASTSSKPLHRRPSPKPFRANPSRSFRMRMLRHRSGRSRRSRIGKLDYQDIGSDSGKISLSGAAIPTVASFFSMTKSKSASGRRRRWDLGGRDREETWRSGEHTLRADTYDVQDGNGGRARLGQYRTRGRLPSRRPTEAQAPTPSPSRPGWCPRQRAEHRLSGGAASEATVAEAGETLGPT